MPREIAAEAAVWVAGLHGPNRSRQMERDCLAWQARSAVHRYAFECCTETWLAIPGVTVGDAYKAAARAAAGRSEESAHKRRRSWQAAGALALGITILATWRPWTHGVYVTAIGGMQSVLLEDGTRMSLNTDTKVRTDFGAAQRTIWVDRGEVLFEVAKDAGRPFVVAAGGAEVVALGTVFSVRVKTAGEGGPQRALAVTLMEGQVALRPDAGEGNAGGVASKAMLMKPGERIQFAWKRGDREAALQQIDHPAPHAMAAWTRSLVVFEDVPLSGAVDEMNRYSRTPIVLEGNTDNGLRVSGQYRTGDNLAFARALASLHGLRVTPSDGQIKLVHRRD